MSEKQPHILVSAADVSERVIVCGEPNRVNRIAAHLSEPQLLADNREYRVMKGQYNGVTITLCSTGIGAPSAMIALEELHQCGVRRMVRVGSAGALQPEIELGELIIAEAAVRDEGGSKAYVDAAYPAVSDRELTQALVQYCREAGVAHHCGVVRSHDSFYTDDEARLCDYWHGKGVLGADMETAALMTLGRLRGMAVAAVLTNVVRYQQDVKAGVADYVAADEAMAEGEARAIRAALAALTR
ncbi:nucleoside phosphorylase [Ferrimonas balearica]|uniref:nucleoside phosphorylase n=1 Tax=Ferrimonas balearica TaxID=44012 RepID=UPI001F269931|nr:nucleoside phosphorylase [Ferrimonas balearica]MBY6095912.1 nucleoside phosphorylase [Ferrimonas balearica]